MSLKTLLMPAISQRLLSQERLAKLRDRAEQSRQRHGRPHEVHYFHQVDDPYSALLVQGLERLLARYGFSLQPHVVGPPDDAAAPDRERLIAYSRRDAQRLAQHYQLQFIDPGEQPTEAAVHQVAAQLVAACQSGRFAELAHALSAPLWSGVNTPDGAKVPPLLPPASREMVTAHMAESRRLRQRLGHYLGATLYYEGEWYWGIDRLYHLEQRLQALGAQRGAVAAPLFPPPTDLQVPQLAETPAVIDFFFSLRSPYSAIVAPRVFRLGLLTQTPVRLRYVLPMVMRGLPVPAEKRRYISLDAAREARARGIPFGRLNDPVGRPTERGLALMPLAEREGKAERYLLSFMQGVWSEGLDAGSTRGLRSIVLRAGLSWDDAQQALLDESWRTTAERNRQDLFALGLWGVPSFQVHDTAVWGQDRLWLVQEALLRQDEQGLPARPR